LAAVPTTTRTGLAETTRRFAEEAVPLAPSLRELRRDLHRHPELGNHLPRTQAAVLAALEGLPLRIVEGESLSSVVAVLEGGRPGPAVLLRGDMDALPVRENSGEEFSSLNENMHACGHDLHTAGLVGAARLLSAHRQELAGSVVFMFQPGEEGPGGAQPMIEEGLLQVTGERPAAAYGIHVMPRGSGLAVYRPGPTMAGSYVLSASMKGRGGHGSTPSASVDPVPPLVEFVGALQAAVTREFNVFDPVVATVTQLRAGGEAPNVIGDTASCGATVRAMTRQTGERFGEVAERLAAGIAAAHGCEAEVRYEVVYPPTASDPAEAQFAAETLRGVLGEEKVVEAPHAVMGSEDFSYVLEQVPGAFIFMGAAPADVDPAEAAVNHSAEARFDDAVLPTQAAALAALAFDRLARAEEG
jgi:amidohydrolase